MEEHQVHVCQERSLCGPLPRSAHSCLDQRGRDLQSSRMGRVQSCDDHYRAHYDQSRGVGRWRNGYLSTEVYLDLLPP